MKRIAVLVFAVCAFGSNVPSSAAQTPSTPPKVLLIEREEIKAGRMDAHRKLANGYVQAFADAKGKTHWLGMAVVAGNENEALFVTAYESYGAVEKDRAESEKMMTGATKLAVDRLDRQGADLHVSQRQILAEYREDLSYKPAVNIPEMRYFEITTTRVRPGHERAFEEARKIVKTAHEKAAVTEHFAIYEVASGASGTTYLTFVPIKSLAEWDVEVHTKAYQEALGDDNRKKIDKMRAEGIMSVDTALYAFDPKMSYAPPEFATADPFWSVKTSTVAKTKPAKKHTARKAAKGQ
jgi:hypothetical protein